MDGVFEEVDLATGKVLTHWSSLDHVGLAESYAGIPENADEPYDYFHINSIKPTPDGHFLVSARHTWCIYKIAAGTGSGAAGDSAAGRATTSCPARPRLHGSTTRSSRRHHDPTVRQRERRHRYRHLGESGAVAETSTRPRSSATLIRRLAHPDKISAAAMGNSQLLDNGNLVVGWGTTKRVSEFARDGSLVFDASLPNMTYRCFRRRLALNYGSFVRHQRKVGGRGADVADF